MKAWKETMWSYFKEIIKKSSSFQSKAAQKIWKKKTLRK